MMATFLGAVLEIITHSRLLYFLTLCEMIEKQPKDPIEYFILLCA